MTIASKRLHQYDVSTMTLSKDGKPTPQSITQININADGPRAACDAARLDHCRQYKIDFAEVLTGQVRITAKIVRASSRDALTHNPND